MKSKKYESDPRKNGLGVHDDPHDRFTCSCGFVAGRGDFENHIEREQRAHEPRDVCGIHEETYIDVLNAKMAYVLLRRDGISVWKVEVFKSGNVARRHATIKVEFTKEDKLYEQMKDIAVKYHWDLVDVDFDFSRVTATYEISEDHPEYSHIKEYIWHEGKFSKR